MQFFLLAMAFKLTVKYINCTLITRIADYHVVSDRRGNVWLMHGRGRVGFRMLDRPFFESVMPFANINNFELALEIVSKDVNPESTRQQWFEWLLKGLP